MDPIGHRLAELLNRPVRTLDDCVGPAVDAAVSRMDADTILLLENTRFHQEEKDNNPTFVKKLASLADVCVFDAFAHAHRDHASTTGLVQALPTVLGPLMVHELTELRRLTASPARPYVVVLGGAKITDKLHLLARLIHDADVVLVGGAIANVFLRARGIRVGQSILASDDVDGRAVQPLEIAARLDHVAGSKLVLPTDMVAGDDKRAPAVVMTIDFDTQAIPTNLSFFDIGPATIRQFRSRLQSARTVFWNGAMGVSTTPAYEAGTRAIAEALAQCSSALTVAGGGDTEQAIHQFGLLDQFSHVSTGGGAALTVVSGGELAVVAALRTAA
jgi:phosphoglycerate kinase